MRALARVIDRFCYRRPRFGIPGLIRYVVFGTGIVYLFGLMDTTQALYALLAFSPADILNGQVWRLFTFVFVTLGQQPWWMILMLYVSFMLGTSLEQSWGTAKFTIYFLLNMVVLAAVGMLAHLLLPWHFSFSIWAFVNGTYLHIFMFLVFATLYSDAPFRFLFVIPMRGMWAGLISLGFLIYLLLWFFRFLFPANLIPLALFLVYFIFTWDIWGHRLRLRSRQRSSTVVNFNRAAKQVEKQRQQRSYTRKCAVCGKTDADNPDLEFRYCSRCNGYHCFCMEHINNHTHFQ